MTATLPRHSNEPETSSTVSVSIFGTGTTVTFELVGDDTVGSVLASTQKILGAGHDDVDLSTLHALRNSQDADMGETVEAGDRITAAPGVSNG